MRILIVHNILNDSRSVSGVLTEYAHMANAWNELGHPTDFLVAKAGWPQFQKLAPKARLVNSDGIFNATRYLSKTWLYFPAYAYRLLTAHWVRLPARYDVIYASSHFIVEVYGAHVLARRQRAKFVVKVQHVLATQTARTGVMDRLFLWAERRSAHLINRHADLLLALSGTVGRDYQQFERSLGLSPHPIQTSGCGVDLDPFTRAAGAPKKYDVVFLSRLHEQKGIFELPEVWRVVQKDLPGAHLLVIGEGPHRGRLEQMIRDHQLQDSVTFTGAIPEREKHLLLAQSKVGLSLSFEEGWGLSITEFLASGLPVVAYELPVFREIFPGQLQIVPVHDQAGAAATILSLLRNDERRDALGIQAREFVTRYDFRAIAQGEMDSLKGLFI